MEGLILRGGETVPLSPWKNVPLPATIAPEMKFTRAKRGSKPSLSAWHLASLGTLLLCLLALVLGIKAARLTSASWPVFRDPVYGYTLAYPPSWLRFTERDGSHLTLYNPLTRTTMSPIITTQSGSPATLLQQALGVADTLRITLAGRPAAATLTPYLPEPVEDNTINLPADGGPQQVDLVTLPVVNLAGTTTLYRLRLTQPTDLQGRITPAERADLRDFRTLFSSFTLPAQIRSFAQPVGPCDRICWADANWNETSYDDAPSLSCTNPAWYFAAYSSHAYCGNQAGRYIRSYNVYDAQVPVSQTGVWQPNFQCADFVARALTQDGLVPGLNNGGISGRSPASPTIGGYDSYQAANGEVYHLWNVGVPGIPGLSNYLLDNQLATNIHVTLAQARPGDVVFFLDRNGRYYHTMLIASLGDGYLVMDGHNAAQYHVVLKATDFKLDIYHLLA